MLDLTQLPGAALVGGAVLAFVAIGFVDYATGTELRVFPLYFLPVLTVSLRLGQGPGLVAAVASSFTWLVSTTWRGSAPAAPSSRVPTPS